MNEKKFGFLIHPRSEVSSDITKLLGFSPSDQIFILPRESTPIGIKAGYKNRVVVMAQA